ncbi:MAG: AAA family ATPase, partial [Candidatus Pacebacteria bacterium]|nr:AAA family ATPase [Candidatus Paceibacterota bacterium]
EIEKAHPDVFNVLLQIFDDGRLTDGKGRTVDFRNTVVIMTSNIAGHKIQELTEESGADWEIEAHVKDTLKQFFRPEFLNRIDETVIFHSLSEKEISKIFDLQFKILSNRLAKQNIKIKITDKAKKLISKKGYEPSFGARPLKRAIQNEILDELALQIIEERIKEGDVIVIDSIKDKIILNSNKMNEKK